MCTVCLSEGKVKFRFVRGLRSQWRARSFRRDIKSCRKHVPRSKTHTGCESSLVRPLLIKLHSNPFFTDGCRCSDIDILTLFIVLLFVVHSLCWKTTIPPQGTFIRFLQSFQLNLTTFKDRKIKCQMASVTADQSLKPVTERNVSSFFRFTFKLDG